MRHKSKNKTRTLSLEMTRLVNETRLLLVPALIRIYTVLYILLNNSLGPALVQISESLGLNY